MVDLEMAEKMFMLPVACYHSAKECSFLSTAHQDDNFFEAVGNFLLTPASYLLGGKQYVHIRGKAPDLVPMYNNENHPFIQVIKIVMAILALPVSLVIGSIFKGIGLMFESGKHHYRDITHFYRNKNLNRIATEHFFSSEPAKLQSKRTLRPTKKPEAADCARLERLVGKDITTQYAREICALGENNQKDLIAFKELADLLNRNGIPWWVDAGTLLGTYRHEGMIPWDGDIDISIPEEYHDHLRAAFEKDSFFASKYQLMDWSTGSQPKTLLKLYVKETGSMIDIYHYRHERDSSGGEVVRYLSPHFDKWYMPHELNKREFVTDLVSPRSNLFPLKKAKFEGIDVWVPNETETWLHRYYDGDLRPAKIWDEAKQEWIKDLSHPYWANHQ